MSTTRDKALRLGRLLAGPAPLPEGWTLLGTVRHPADGALGALVQLPNGIRVHYAAGTVRSLPAIDRLHEVF